MLSSWVFSPFAQTCRAERQVSSSLQVRSLFCEAPEDADKTSSTGLEFTSRILLVVRAINKNELSLNSVHRIFAFSSIEQEEEDTSKGDPPASWPEGEIEVSGLCEERVLGSRGLNGQLTEVSRARSQFDNYSAKYSEDGPDVLHDLSFKIKVGEKIGVVGPSGCGKSSLCEFPKVAARPLYVL